jgi:hypothetical protein
LFHQEWHKYFTETNRSDLNYCWRTVMMQLYALFYELAILNQILQHKAFCIGKWDSSGKPPFYWSLQRNCLTTLYFFSEVTKVII